MVLDGSERVNNIIRLGIDWDVMGGVARRAWARNEGAVETVIEWNMTLSGRGQITLPFTPIDGLVEGIVRAALKEKKG